MTPTVVKQITTKGDLIMSTENTDTLRLNRAEIGLMVSKLRQEIAELNKEKDRIEDDIQMRRQFLTKLQQYRISSGNGSDPSEEFTEGVRGIFLAKGPKLPIRDLLDFYKKSTGQSISRNRLLNYLHGKRGTLYEVTGKKGGAKWILIKRDETDENTT